MTPLLWLALIGCASDVPTASSPASTTASVDLPTNVLLILTDDHGVEAVGAYGVGDLVPRTPNMDALAARGVLFRSAYATPFCSSTRANLLTGRQTWQHGVGRAIHPWEDDVELAIVEPSLPRTLAEGGYTSALLGKYHLASMHGLWMEHPSEMGFTHSSGPMANIGSYYAYDKALDGQLLPVRRYATTETVDDAIATMQWIGEPWLVWVGFNAVHAPIHRPPEALTAAALPDRATQLDHHLAVVEAMDTEIGRLLAAVPDPAHTTVILMGDNGSDGWLIRPRANDGGKGTVRETGVRVPLIVAGPHVPTPGESDALVSATDVFPTLAELAGVDVPADLDGVSFAASLADPAAPSARDHVVSETFSPFGSGPYGRHEQMVRDGRYKLIRSLDAPDQLFDLEGVDREGDDLLLGELTEEQATALAALVETLDAIQRE